MKKGSKTLGSGPPLPAFIELMPRLRLPGMTDGEYNINPVPKVRIGAPHIRRFTKEEQFLETLPTKITKEE